MTEYEALNKIQRLIDIYWGVDLVHSIHSENTAEAGAAKLCRAIGKVIHEVMGKSLKYKIGDRITYHNKGSENDGRLGLVIGVSDTSATFTYYVSLDATETQPNKIFWTCEDVLEPYTETRETESISPTASETFRDRLKREHPEALEGNFIGGCKNCPCDYGYEIPPKVDGCDGPDNEACRKCWDRQIPRE